MTAIIPFSYINTTNAAGAFTSVTEGGVQGTFFDDPAARYALRSGVVSYSETLPMWGGVGIYEQIPTPSTTNPVDQLGPIIGRATTLTATTSTGLSGFAMFNQTHNAVVSTQSNVPMAASGMTFNYVRLGSGARIVVACDPSMVSLEGGAVGQAVSWDFNNQVLQPNTSTPTYSVTSLTWSSTNGGQIAVVAGVATLVAGVGDYVTFSGATNSGTGGAAAINTNFVVNTFTDNQHFTVSAPGTSAYYGTIAGTILMQAGTGALACRVDMFLTGQSVTVLYNALTQYANWNYASTCAVITI
jgi:hypothetical protein